MRPCSRRSIRALALIALATGLVMEREAEAEGDGRRPAIEIGGGLAIDVLGDFDVGESLGGEAAGSDLGNATLALLATSTVRPTDVLLLGAEGSLAFGGLVRTDERYVGDRSAVGSTATLQVRGVGGLVIGRRGASRAAPASPSASSACASRPARARCARPGDRRPWLGLRLSRIGVEGRLRADLHVPTSGQIGDGGDGRRGDPSGAFVSFGGALAYSFGLGDRGE